MENKLIKLGIPALLIKNFDYELKQFSNLHSKSPVYILKNRETGALLLLNEYDYFLWNSIDGINTLPEIVKKFLEKYEKNSEEYILIFVQKLSKAGLIQNYKIKKNQNKRSIFDIRISIPFFNKIMFFCYKLFGKFLYNWCFFIVYFCVALAGTLVFFSMFGKNIVLQGINNYWYVFLLYVIPIIIHEMSHAFSCFYYNRTIYDSGFMFYMFIPAFYVNTSDIWMENRKSRFIVSISGPMCDIFIGALSILIYNYYNQSSYFYLMACASFTRGFFNLNPFFKWDGYYCLMDILDIYNLSQSANYFLFKIYPQRIFKYKTFLLTKKELILLLYGISSRLFFIYFFLTLSTNLFGILGKLFHGEVIRFTASLITSILLVLIPFLSFVRYLISKIGKITKRFFVNKNENL